MSHFPTDTVPHFLNKRNLSVKSAILFFYIKIVFVTRCSLTSSDCGLNGITILKKFGSWREDDKGIGKRMPYLSADDKSLLSTSNCNSPTKYGTIVSEDPGFSPAQWITGDSENPGIIWYWIKESSTMLLGKEA